MNSYAYDPKSAIEKERIFVREKHTSQRRSIAFEGLEIPPKSSILDVGCGTGVLGFDLLSRFPDSRLCCLDIEPSILVQAARDQHSLGVSSYVASDAYRLPFDDKSYDVVACQYLLQHLANPVWVLEEMRRVSKKRALAIVFEWDDGSNIVYPPIPSELERVFEAKAKLIHSMGGDRNIGRKLYYLLSEAGWEEIDIKLIHDIWQGPADRSASLKGSELSFLELKSQILDRGFVSEDDFNIALKQLNEFYNGDIFSVVFFFAAFARSL